MSSKKYSPVNFRGAGELQAGDMRIYQDGSWVKLSIGIPGSIFTSQGPGLPPIWDGSALSSSSSSFLV